MYGNLWSMNFVYSINLPLKSREHNFFCEAKLRRRVETAQNWVQKFRSYNFEAVTVHRTPEASQISFVNFTLYSVEILPIVVEVFLETIKQHKISDAKLIMKLIRLVALGLNDSVNERSPLDVWSHQHNNVQNVQIYSDSIHQLHG